MDVFAVLQRLALERDVVFAGQLANFFKDFTLDMLSNFLSLLQRVHGPPSILSRRSLILTPVNHCTNAVATGVPAWRFHT